MTVININKPDNIRVGVQDMGHTVNIDIYPPGDHSRVDELKRYAESLKTIRDEDAAFEIIKRHVVMAIPKALTLRDRTKNALVLTTEDARELNEISLGLIRHLQTIAEASGALPAAKPSESGEDS